MSNLQFAHHRTDTDLLGAGASALCMIHCMATPYLFIVGAGVAAKHKEGPIWWGLIDVLLLFVSLFAVYRASKNTSKRWMKYALYISWVLLTLFILNEKLQGIPLAEEIIYIPVISLALLHLYNRKYCQCTDEKCCSVSEGS
jgi:hypothetical protein